MEPAQLNMLRNIEQRLSSIIAKSLTEAPRSLYTPMQYALEDGGKRVRPFLALMAADLYDLPHHTDSYDALLNAASAIELYHNFTLLHDDVMDNSMLRRGKPSVMAKFGIPQTVLTGDAMMALSYQIIGEVRQTLGIEYIQEQFYQMATDIMEGQQLDMDFEEKQVVIEAEYLTMIAKKTAALIIAPLCIGAAIAGASPKECSTLSEVAALTGRAFQLCDDYLDVYGNEKTFGKPIGGDIAERKKTWLYIKAYNIAEQKGEIAQFIEAFDMPTANNQRYQAVRVLYDRYEIDQAARAEIIAASEKACALIQGLSEVKNEEARLRLIQFIEQLATRKI